MTIGMSSSGYSENRSHDGKTLVHHLDPNMNLLDYFDRVSIIHLRMRADRYRDLVRELLRLNIEITNPKVCIPEAPMPTDANGFPSKGVYGSFLSHLDILKSAREDGLQTVWILEDDAIFSHRLIRQQDKIAKYLARTEWDICYFGHTLTGELKRLPIGLPRYSGPFYWAHCYAVHARVLPRLIAYVEETVNRPSGDPRGGKVYIDAAYTLFRRFNPDVVARVANPVLSLQRGSQSSLGRGYWYDRYPLTRPAIQLARVARDECWRWTGWTFGGAAPRKLDDVQRV
jgi:glycosyl transferase, family 25